MTQTLPQVAHEHHERILVHVDRLPQMADGLLTPDADTATADVVAAHAFFVGTLVPHVDAAERSLYPELERLFQNRHSMAPMRKEHDEIRRLVGAYGTLTADVKDGRISLGRTLALRRVIFQLYALLKVHLAEEDAYLRIIDRGAGAEMGDAIAAALEHPIAG
ncbi:MAG TPA: hemerythrin domain-containing protein [Candidatus Limnocylindrales bacterium]|jgi:iron-sulfur cluster repair protein YtfE (RIC family)